MRIITEDNIKQLENMTYSKNIDKLTFQTNTEPKAIVSGNTRLLAEMNKEPHNVTPNQYYTPEMVASDQYNSPIMDSTPGSPPYAPNSPGVFTDSMIAAEIEARQNATSPLYFVNTPESPPYAPNSPGVFTDSMLRVDREARKQAQQNATSPLYNPYTSEEEELLNEMSQRAREYKTGDSVFYRGDETENRVWQVISIGDKYIKIETNMPR